MANASHPITARRTLWVAGFVVVIALVGVAGTMILPMVLPRADDHVADVVDVAQVGGGSFQFGTAGSACTVIDAVSTLPAAKPIHVVGVLRRPALRGQTIVVTVTASATTMEMRRTHVWSPTRCVAIDIPAGAAPPDRYTFDLLVDDELVASGTVDVTP